MTDTCMIQRLGHYVTLTDNEKEALGELEKDPRDYGPGETIIDEGHVANTLFVVQKGWLYESTDMLDGRRQILRLHFPGDVMGSTSIAFEQATKSVTTLDETTVCQFPKSALREIYERHPRLAALFYAISMLENVAITDRLKSLGSADARGRVAALLLDIQARLRTTEGPGYIKINVPLTQANIGEALGLTNVHVNRTLKQLEKLDKAIRRDGREYTILREDFLVEVSSYIDRYHSIDYSWFPAPR